MSGPVEQEGEGAEDAVIGGCDGVTERRMRFRPSVLTHTTLIEGRVGTTATLDLVELRAEHRRERERVVSDARRSRRSDEREATYSHHSPALTCWKLHF